MRMKPRTPDVERRQQEGAFGVGREEHDSVAEDAAASFAAISMPPMPGMRMSSSAMSGCELADQLQRRIAVACATDQLEAALAVEEAADGVEYRRMVVRDDAANGARGHHDLAVGAAHAAPSESALVAPTSSGSGRGAGRAKK